MTLTDARLQRMSETVEARFLDLVTVRRPGAVVDIEGDTGGVPLVVLEPDQGVRNGTIANPRSRDRETAATLGQQLDAFLTITLAADVELGDLVEAAGRDESWTVIGVERLRFVTRAGLRRIE